MRRMCRPKSQVNAKTLHFPIPLSATICPNVPDYARMCPNVPECATNVPPNVPFLFLLISGVALIIWFVWHLALAILFIHPLIRAWAWKRSIYFIRMCWKMPECAWMCPNVLRMCPRICSFVLTNVKCCAHDMTCMAPGDSHFSFILRSIRRFAWKRSIWWKKPGYES